MVVLKTTLYSLKKWLMCKIRYVIMYAKAMSSAELKTYKTPASRRGALRRVAGILAISLKRV